MCRCFEDTTIDWDEAEAACNDWGGHLVRISSETTMTKYWLLHPVYRLLMQMGTVDWLE